MNRLLGEQVDTLALVRLGDCAYALDDDLEDCPVENWFTIRNDPRLNIVMIQVYQWSMEAARELEVLRQEAVAMAGLIDQQLASLQD